MDDREAKPGASANPRPLDDPHGLISEHRRAAARASTGPAHTRAEITDAAMDVQAECVMLNKGLRIIEAISVLDSILRRMERHHRRKRSLLPRPQASDYVHTDRGPAAAQALVPRG